MDEKELILQLKALKEIKPRENWVVFTKSQILSEKKVENFGIGEFVENCKLIIENSFTRRLAYVFAAVLFVVVGIFGLTQYTAVDDQAIIKQNVAAISNSVSDLAEQGKTESVMNEIKSSVSELARNLKTKETNPAVMKGIAVSLKTLADVTGLDLSANPDVENLYKAVVQNQISDLEKATLTEEQVAELDGAKYLYDQGKYTDALEKILLINK